MPQSGNLFWFVSFLSIPAPQSRASSSLIQLPNQPHSSSTSNPSSVFSVKSNKTVVIRHDFTISLNSVNPVKKHIWLANSAIQWQCPSQFSLQQDLPEHSLRLSKNWMHIFQCCHGFWPCSKVTNRSLKVAIVIIVMVSSYHVKSRVA